MYQVLYPVSLFRMNNQYGHWMCSTMTSRQNAKYHACHSPIYHIISTTTTNTTATIYTTINSYVYIFTAVRFCPPQKRVL